MKVFVVFILTLVSFQALSQEAIEHELDFESSVKLLKNSPPTLYGGFIIAITKDPTKKAEMFRLFSEQISAIATIQKSHKEVDLSILLPFLSTTTDINFFLMHSARLQTLETSRVRWPVLALIMDMPNAAQALEKYSLEDKNPINYRLDAYVILSLVDKDRGHKIAAQLKEEMEKASATTHIQALKDGLIVQFIDRVDNGGFLFDSPVCIGGDYAGPRLGD